MGIDIIQVRDGDFMYDKAVTRKIIQSWRVAKYAAHGRIEEDEASSLFGAGVYSVHIDWDQLRQKKEYWTDYDVTDFWLNTLLMYGGWAAIRDLQQKVKETRQYKQDLKEKIAMAQRMTRMDIDRAVSNGKLGEDVAKFVRDASIETLVICSGILAGPGASAMVKAGIGATSGVLKGAAKYQDTGNLGAAAYTANTELIFSLVPVPVPANVKNVTMKEAGNIVFYFTVKAGAEDFAGGIIEGKQISEAAQSAALSIAFAGAGDVLKNETVQKALRRSAFPGVVKLSGNNLTNQKHMLKATTQAGTKLTNMASKKGVEMALAPDAPEDRIKAEKASAMSLIDDAMLVDMALSPLSP